MNRRRKLLDPNPPSDRELVRTTSRRQGYLRALSRVAGGHEATESRPDPAAERVRIIDVADAERVAS